MDSSASSKEMDIRKIEDIIDIQKANGNIGNVRQVVFNLPSKTDSITSASLAKSLAKSLETGLSRVKSQRSKVKINKRVRSKRRKCSLPDVAAWPSDSDITVLRMKLCLASDGKKKVGTVVPGDGLHQQDNSSMVNLATLMMKSQPPSKHSLNLEEYLLPLTSWENVDCDAKDLKVNNEGNEFKFGTECHVIDATCSHDGTEHIYSDKGDSNAPNLSTKSKVAKFLRLYFCPCCTCLYNMEKLRDAPSAYSSKK